MLNQADFLRKAAQGPDVVDYKLQDVDVRIYETQPSCRRLAQEPVKGERVDTRMFTCKRSRVGERFQSKSRGHLERDLPLKAFRHEKRFGMFLS